MAASIKWNRKAIKQFEDAVEYIENISPSGAEKFVLDIIHKIDKPSFNPEKFSHDKYEINNDGTFRAFEMHHYRISYRVIKNQIRIIRVRHTKMNPLPY